MSNNNQPLVMRRIRHIHFVGIGGAGMSGIAEVLLNLGYSISGSDLSENKVIQRLISLKIKVFKGHAAEHIQGADVLVISTAIDPKNPEVEAAQAAHIPVVKRAEMLAELMRFKHGIAVAGTHGKTTTTSLVASILAEDKLDPTFVIGGQLNSLGANANLGKGQYFVAEADESDASFLLLQPLMSIVTNISADHLDTYNQDFATLKQAFIDFLHHLPFYGLAVLCIDDAEVRSILPQVARPLLTYGIQEEADFQAINIEQHCIRSRFTVIRPAPAQALDITLNIPGRHNILNALAAIAIATECGVSDAAIQRALEQFAGVGRRFQRYGDFKTAQGLVTLVDDYGHHPRELEATIQAAKQAWPERRLVMLFQPHRYSRTRDLFNIFVSVLSTVDQLLLLDIYPASESPLPGVSSEALKDAIEKIISHKVVLIADLQAIPSVLTTILKENDVLLTQGAGSVGQIAAQLAEQNLCWERAYVC